MTKAPVEYATVPRLWAGETAAILATGPSLCQEDVDYCRGKARVLVIKDAVRLAPWADVLYSGDGKWFKEYGKGLQFEGPRYSLDEGSSQWASILKNTGEMGLDLQPNGLRTGRHSGYQAINLAVHLGATRLVLLGYDAQPLKSKNHFHGEHPWGGKPVYTSFLQMFPFIVQPLKNAGVEVLNASRVSALSMFPRVQLREVLQ